MYTIKFRKQNYNNELGFFCYRCLTSMVEWMGLNYLSTFVLLTSDLAIIANQGSWIYHSQYLYWATIFVFWLEISRPKTQICWALIYPTLFLFSKFTGLKDVLCMHDMVIQLLRIN